MVSTSPLPPKVTVVVVPRERFSAAPRSLDSIYRETGEPFALVYVDGGSPPPVRRYLEAEAGRRGFRLLRTDHYLSPNQARNLGAAAVETPFLVFIDNDVIVTPGWLSALVRCAEETGASVVGPLCLIGELAEQRIHMASGEVRIEERLGRRRLIERHLHSGKTVDEVRERLTRTECDLAEFHTLLVRTEMFRRLGPLDERLLNTREHVDFCMSVRQGGGHRLLRARLGDDVPPSAKAGMVRPAVHDAAVERGVEPHDPGPLLPEVGRLARQFR